MFLTSVRLTQDIFPAVSCSPDLSILLLPSVLQEPPLARSTGHVVSPLFHFSYQSHGPWSATPNQDSPQFWGGVQAPSAPEPAGAQSQWHQDVVTAEPTSPLLSRALLDHCSARAVKCFRPRMNA